MNVTSSAFADYWTTFLEALAEGAATHLKPELRSKLLHLSLLPARVQGYVSTSFGVAVLFEQDKVTSVSAMHGSARIEDLLVHCPPRLRGVGPMFSFGGRNSGLAKLTLDGAFPFRLSNESADVTLQDVGFKAGSWHQVIHYAEVYGDRSAARWTRDRALIRAKDELLVALVDDSRAAQRGLSIEDYISHFKKKMVLLLGDYDTDGLKRLESIADALRSLGYEPIIVRDVPDHPHQDIAAKVIALGAVSRFVVVDDSSKSGHLMEVQLCKNNDWITVLLRADGKGGSWMTAGASATRSIVLEQAYDPAAPRSGVSVAVTWAEEQIQRLELKFENTYPWRGDAS